MPSRNPSLVEAVVRELAVVMADAVEVAEVTTNTDRRVVTATHHQAGKASAVTVAHRILQGNVLRMDKTVTPVVRLVTTVDTVTQSKDHQRLGRRSRREMHDLEPDEEYEYDTIQIIHKVKFSSSCRKEHYSNKNNVMFDEIADVPKRNLRMLSDLYAQSRS